MRVFCKKCKQEFSEDLKVCPNCGQERKINLKLILIPTIGIYSLIMIVFFVIVINSETKESNNVTITTTITTIQYTSKDIAKKELTESERKSIFLEIYQAEWYILNEMEKPVGDYQFILNEKEYMYGRFATKYSLLIEEIKKISEKNEYAQDGFIKCKLMEKNIGKVPKNY